jgi:hypothetical protein
MNEIDEAELVSAGERGAAVDGALNGVKRVVQAALLRKSCYELRGQIDPLGLRLNNLLIHGELAGLGIRLAPSTVWETPKKAGLDPAPRRAGPTWAEFLRSQTRAILAADFFTVSLLDGTTVYVLAVIEHATRRIRILGSPAHLTGAWATQQARNLLMDLDDAAEKIGFLIRDRDASSLRHSTQSSRVQGSALSPARCRPPGRTRSWSDG